MRLPAYQASGSLDIGNGPRLNSPDVSIANAFTNVGHTPVNAAEDLTAEEKKTQAKLRADHERTENLNLEYDLIQQGNIWRDKLQKAQEEAPENAADFTDNFQRQMQSDVDALTQKYANHHDPALVRVKIASSQNPLLDAASKYEFTAGLAFKKKVIDEKVVSLSSAFAAGPGVSLEQAEAAYKKFVDTAISGNENVRKQGYEYGLRTIQKAYIAARAAEDSAAFITEYKKTISADADNAVLPPHLSTTITNAQAQGFDPSTMLAIGWIESRLNPDAGRPTRRDGTQMSSAEGMFQVLAGDSSSARATRDALGISKEDVRDVDKVSTALSAFLVRKQEWMRANRIDPTPGKTYMMWNMGEGAAAAVMRANPNERIEVVLTRVWASQGPKFLHDALHNNPSMYRPGMTVGQVIANYEAKMQNASDTVGKITAGAGLSVEDRAKTFVTQFAGIKDNQYVTAADLAEIAEKVVTDYGRQQKASLEIERGTARINGELPMDPYSSEHKKDVEKALEPNFPPLVEGITQGDGGSLSTVRAIADEVRHIPEPLRNAMRATLETGDDHAKASVYGTLLDLRKSDRTAFSASNFGRDTEKRIEEFEAFTTEMMLEPGLAISRIDRLRSEEGKLRAEAIKSDVNKELGKVTDRGLLEIFGGGSWFGSLTVGSADYDLDRLTPVIRTHFETAYRDAREDGKDKSEAEAFAANSLKTAFGVSSAAASSGQIITLHPPEAHYPALRDGHSWIIEQARNRVAVRLLELGQIKSEPENGTPAWQLAEDKAKSVETRLIPTAQTSDDVRRGHPPRYQLWFRNDQGQAEMADAEFRPDAVQAQIVDKARFVSSVRQQPRAANRPVPRIGSPASQAITGFGRSVARIGAGIPSIIGGLGPAAVEVADDVVIDKFRQAYK